MTEKVDQENQKMQIHILRDPACRQAGIRILLEVRNR